MFVKHVLNSFKTSSKKWILAVGVGTGTAVVAGRILPTERQPELGPLATDFVKEISAAARTVAEAGEVSAAAFGTAVLQAVATLQSNRGYESSHVTGGIVRWLADYLQDAERREAVVAYGGDYLLDWLLHALFEDPSYEQSEAERAIICLLQSDATARAILERPGAVPRLLQHVSSGKASDELVGALQRHALQPRAVQNDALLADLVDTVEMLQGAHGLLSQCLAASFLAAWVDASPTNRHKLTGLGLHQAVAQVAVAASGMGVGLSLDLQWELVRIIGALAGGGAAQEASHHLACCVEPLLYVAADAAVEGDERLAGCAIHTLFHCCSAGGAPVCEALACSNLWPLLKKLSAGAGPVLQHEIVKSVLLLCEKGLLPEQDVPYWRDWLLQVACLGSDDLQSDAVSALEGLCQLPGATGLRVAHYWLARLLRSLADKVSPYNAYVRADGLRSPEALLDAVPVLPSFVKSLAGDLERASDAAAQEVELPPEYDLAHGGHQRLQALRLYQEAAHAMDAFVAERKMCKALEVLNAMVSADPSKQQWLVSVGILSLLRRLCLDAVPAALQPSSTMISGSGNGAEPGSSSNSSGTASQQHSQDAAAATSMHPHRAHDGLQHGGGLNGSLNREAARLLSMLALQPQALAEISQPAWQAWLKRACLADDCALASYATKALLHTQVMTSASILSALSGMQLTGTPHPSIGGTHAPLANTPDKRAVHSSSSSSSSSSPSHQEAAMRSTGDAPGSRVSRDAAPAGTATHQHSPSQPAGTASLIPDGTPRQRHTSDNPATPCPKQAPTASNSIMAAAAANGTPASAALHPGLSTAPIFLDGVHLMDPFAKHHRALALKALRREAHQLRSHQRQQLLQQFAEAQPEVTQAGTAAHGNSMHAAGDDASSGVSNRGSSAASSSAAYSENAGSVVPFLQLPRPWRLPRSLSHLASMSGAVASISGASPAPRSTRTSNPSSSNGGGSSSSSSTGTMQDLHSMSPLPADGRFSRQANAEATDVTATTPILYDTSAMGQLLPLLSSSAAVDGNGKPLSTGDSWEEPKIDVVFVHGIRGGPFITWRRPELVAKYGKVRDSQLPPEDCWPCAWLPEDFPQARLLTVEYLAPVSGWEGESLPLEHTVSRLMEQLVAAGVGQRPLVFVAHSMGGLLVKEILARSMAQAEVEEAAAAAAAAQPHSDIGAKCGSNLGTTVVSHAFTIASGQALVAQDGAAPFKNSCASLAQATKGIVFYATPHFGSRLAAMGWRLRHVPYANPAPSLERLTPGPHLIELNAKLQELYSTGAIRVVSVVEGQATDLAKVLPKLVIVPYDSAYPGFGGVVAMQAQDHISVCKPADKKSPSYAIVHDMLTNVIADIEAP